MAECSQNLAVEGIKTIAILASRVRPGCCTSYFQLLVDDRIAFGSIGDGGDAESVGVDTRVDDRSLLNVLCKISPHNKNG